MSGLSRITNGILDKTIQTVNYILPIRVSLKPIKTNLKVDKIRIFNIRVKRKIGG